MIEELKSKGWFLSNDGLDICKEGLERITLSSVIQKALDTDLRDISEPCLSDEIYKNKVESITGPCVLQIQKLKNVSAPKYEASNNGHLLLRLLLTDGHVNVSCLQWGSWKHITLDTPPGTKISIKPVKVQVQNGFLLLRESQFTMLGGHVMAMVEKWELSKRLASHRRGEGSEDGPPPWIPFGNAISYKDPKVPSGNFKSLEQECKEQKENAVFKQQRMATIAEVSKAKEGKTKVFGGGKEKQANSKSESNSWEPEQQQQTKHNQTYTNSYEKLDGFYNKSDDNQNFYANQDQKRNENNYKLYKTEKDFNRTQGQKQENYRSFDANKPKRTAAESKSKFEETNTKKPYTEQYSKPKSDFGTNNWTNNTSRTSTYPRNDSTRYDPSRNFSTSSDRSQDLNDMMAQMNVRSQGRHDNQQIMHMPTTRHYLKHGANVLARYWEDKKFYHAVIHAVGDNDTCVVHFTEYGNYEEVRTSDIRPLSANWNSAAESFHPTNFQQSGQKNMDYMQNKNNFMGSLEFRRGGNKPYVHHSGNDDNGDRQRDRRQDYRPAPRLYQPPPQRQSQ